MTRNDSDLTRREAQKIDQINQRIAELEEEYRGDPDPPSCDREREIRTEIRELQMDRHLIRTGEAGPEEQIGA